MRFVDEMQLTGNQYLNGTMELSMSTSGVESIERAMELLMLTSGGESIERTMKLSMLISGVACPEHGYKQSSDDDFHVWTVKSNGEIVDQFANKLLHLKVTYIK